jgi:hypothetical protein
LLRGLRQGHTIDDRFRQPLLGRRQAILLSKPADRRALDLIRIEDHHQNRRGAILRYRAAAEEWKRPHHRAQRRRAGRSRQHDAVDLTDVRIRARTDRGAFADRIVQRAGSRVVDAAQLAVSPETQAVGRAQQKFGGLVDRDDAAVGI